MSQRLTPRRRTESPTAIFATDELRRRRRVAQRVLLENIALDSTLYRRHERRLALTTGRIARLQAYEQTLAEAGLLDTYEALTNTPSGGITA